MQPLSCVSWKYFVFMQLGGCVPMYSTCAGGKRADNFGILLPLPRFRNLGISVTVDSFARPSRQFDLGFDLLRASRFPSIPCITS